MSHASETVTEMAAECEQGRTPALLEKFLRRSFPSGLGDWLFGSRTYEVRKVAPFPDAGFFRTSCVFRVSVRDRFLEAPILPSGGSFGLFAFGSSGLRYLSHQRQQIERLLREEKRFLDECDPQVLASLLAEALLTQRSISHHALESSNLPEYNGGIGRFSGLYQVDAREWDRVRNRVASPALSGDAGNGWRLQFCSVVGWMHQKQMLVSHLFRFRPDFRIQHRKQVLSGRIFARMPSLMY
jgi:DNA-binding transcriptional ArsR family regulator